MLEPTRSVREVFLRNRYFLIVNRRVLLSLFYAFRSRKVLNPCQIVRFFLIPFRQLRMFLRESLLGVVLLRAMLNCVTNAVYFLVFVVVVLLLFVVFLLFLLFLFVFVLFFLGVLLFLFAFFLLLPYSFLLRLVNELRRYVLLFRCVLAEFFIYVVGGSSQ